MNTLAPSAGPEEPKRRLGLFDAVMTGLSAAYGPRRAAARG